MLEDRAGGLTPRQAGDARARVDEFLGLRDWARDAVRFVQRPVYAAQPAAWGRTAALVLAALLALDLLVDGLIAQLVAAWDPEGRFLPDPVALDVSLLEDVISALLLAPVLEELLFRGWLTGRIAALRFAAYGFAAMGLFMASLLAAPGWAMALGLAGVATAFAGLIHWEQTRRRDTAVPAWFTRHFAWFVWGSTLVFGLIHLGNYESMQHPLGLLVVLPQTVGGLLLAYTRTRLGLGAAIAHHAAFNAVLMAGEYGGW